MSNKSYQYNSEIVELDFVSGNYFVIPENIILQKSVDEKRAIVFSYFLIHKELDDEIKFSISDITKWIGRKQNRSKNGVNEKIKQLINLFIKQDYFFIDKNIDNTSLLYNAVLNKNKLSDECKNNRFATIYMDEIYKIINYKKYCKEEFCVKNDIIFLVFSYLRMMIYRRNDDSVSKEKYPEAYDCFYYDIANDLGLSQKTVCQAVKILSEIGLIYYETIKRVKIKNKWITMPTVFCNTYKRYGRFLIENGSDYYLHEIKNKKEKLQTSSKAG